MNINILVIVPALIPTVRIGIIHPMNVLQQKGFLKYNLIFPENFKKHLLDNIDCVIFCRNSGWYEEHILYDVVEKKIPYIYEIDDDFFEISPTTELGRFHRHPLNISALKTFLKYASLVRLYSPLMAENVRPINDKIEINHAYFNSDLVKGLTAQRTDKIKIIYATSRMADEQQAIFSEALKKIAREFLESVEIYFWGAPISDQELDAFPNVFHLQPISDYTKFIQKFYSMGFHIGLAPIFGERFYNSKTNNKYREYGGCQIAGIYSDEPLYQRCITHKENGLLTKNTPEDWYSAIKLIVSDDKLRKRIIENARNDVMKNYSFEHFCDQWLLSLNKVIGHPRNGAALGLYPQNATIECIVYYDYSSIDFCILKDRLLENVYKDTSVIMHPVELTHEMIQNFPNQSVANIIVMTDDQEVIAWFYRQCHDSQELRIIVLSHDNYKVDESSRNIKLLQIPSEIVDLKNIYTHFTQNIYVQIDETIKEFFQYRHNNAATDSGRIIQILKKTRMYFCHPRTIVHALSSLLSGYKIKRSIKGYK